MKVILYGTGCPKCNILKKKLDEKNISYEEFSDVDKMIEWGFKVVPILSIDNEYMNFSAAVKWINNFSGDVDAN